MSGIASRSAAGRQREVVESLVSGSSPRETSRGGMTPYSSSGGGREVGRTSTPCTARIYRLRSYMWCAECGRRFYGKSPKGIGYMVCAPKKAYRPVGHPPSIWVREDVLVDGVTGFLATQVFGQYRHQLLDANLKVLDETTTKSKRLVLSLELADDVDQHLIRDINERRAELRSERDEWRCVGQRTTRINIERSARWIRHCVPPLRHPSV